MWFVSYGLGNSCSKCCWKVLCATRMLFIPLLLGEFLFQCYWNALYAVRAPFIPYHLGNSLVQYCWKVLCTLFALYYLRSTRSNIIECLICGSHTVHPLLL